MIYEGHGTCVASVAGGNTLGVSSKVNLVLIKYTNAAKAPVSMAGLMAGKYKQRQVMARAIQDAFDFIFDDVQVNGLGGRAVINFSGGKFDGKIS